ncbi:MAG: phosphoglycerate dehydrogenase [Gemmatimonadetes bacterium]|nr:phosphoglycerate dehydrogenase [Gemmatimonadota bacterium]|tara:strand:+ start:1454 stop:2452 length:999 start_codon:yes stop_codon:yes gene_type:complete
MAKRGAFFGESQERLDYVYAQGRRERVAEIVDLYPERICLENFDVHVDQLQDLEVIFGTWKISQLQKAHLERLPNLKIVFYGAGTVQNFARPMLEHGVRVCSAWKANAVPVAEYTLAQILLANKGFYTNIRDCQTYASRKNSPFKGRGNFGATVALLGAGAIGSLLIDLLKPFHLELVVFDPFLPAERAAEMGVRKVSLEAAFREGDIVSNHLANNEQTRGMLHGGHFSLLQNHATFINTGRGATVVELDLIAELENRPTLTALLDVTMPEPPDEGSPFYSLDNAYLTSHIAGSLNDEVVRMADYMIEEFQRYEACEELQHEVSPDMIDTMA